MDSYFMLLNSVYEDFCVPDPLWITYIIHRKITSKHSRQKKRHRFLLVCLFFCAFLNKPVMVLGMRECCLFFLRVENWEQGHSILRSVLWKALIFMSFMKLNPSVITILAVLVPGKSKYTNNKTNRVQMEFNPFTGVAVTLCFTQAAWCSHGPPLNGIKYAEQSTASIDCYRLCPTIKFLISDYYEVRMLLFPCHLHRKYVFGDSIPTGK